MSWVVEEWKDGLPTKTLQKIQELESQLDKLKKERQQRQFQLESLEAALQKQKQKAESEKSEVTAMKRENQSLIESCDNQEKTRQKMAHEQQVKDTQISFLEGQLTASKKQIEKLEQDLKRFKNDLERSQQSFNGMDMSLCVTPQKSFAASFTPAKCNEPKYEELQDKYNKEVEERKKLETELKILQIKNSQASQASSQNTIINHRDIARHQASSSVFSWQQERTPSRTSSSSHDTSLKRGFTSTQCPWEQEETPSKRGYKPDTSNRSEPFNTAGNDQLKSQNQELRCKVNELELRLQVQEKELKNQLNKLQETQTLLEKAQTELQEKDKALTKSRDDLARMTSQYDQTADRCAQTELKLKKVADELSCQRQNAESARLTVENKLKEREKENQQELLRQQNSLKNMEQQLNQMKVKLSQESQQAKNEFNAIQSELDRVVHGKKVLEGAVEELKQKLFKAERALQASENQASQFKKNLEEAKCQQNAIRNQLEQKTKEALKMEEEKNVANQTIRQNQQLVDKLTDKNSSLEAELKCSLQKLQGQDSASLQNLKVTLSNLERERDLAQEMLKKRDNDMEESKNDLARMAEESLDLKRQLDCKEKECKDVINTNISLSRWKNEHENNSSQVSIEREEMLARVKELERLIQSHMDQVNALENDKKNLHTQVKHLQELVDTKTADLKTQQATCSKIQQQLESEGQKYQNDLDCLVKRIYELEAEVKLRESDDCSSQVSCLESELKNQKKLSAELQSQHDELLKSKTDSQNEMLQIQALHERVVSESQCQVESLQNNISSKQTYVDSVVSAIREKEDEICMLSEKLRLANSDLQSANQNNKELHDKLQEQTQLSESWATERESLTALIGSNQKEIEMLTADNKQIKELSIMLKNESVDLGSTIGQNEKLDCTDNMEEECMTDSNKSVKECQSLKIELEELTEKLGRIQKENNRLLRANEELTALVESLRNNELSLNKIVEELSVSLQDKEKSLQKLQAQLDSLKMDCKIESISVGDIGECVSSLHNSPSKGVKSHIDPSSKQETVPSSKALKEKKMNILMDGNQTILSDCDSLSADDSVSKILGDINEETLPLSLEPQHREENQTLLINLDQLTLTSTDDVTKSLSQLLELSQIQDQHTASLSPFSSPTLKVHSDETGGKVTRDRKSISGQLVDLILQQAPEEQQVLFSRLTSEDPCSVKDVLTVYQVELGNLQKQYLADIATWQKKLNDQASDMEAKLLEEKARSDQLSQELEAARLELQVLDLSARSLLFDSEDLTTRLDATNQSLCTILPIGRLSLDSESQKCETPKQGQGSSENNSEESPEETRKEEVIENKGKRRSSRQRKKRKTNTADQPKGKDVSEHSQLKTAESSSEKEQLQLIKINQHLLMEMKELSLQIEIHKTELGIKEGQNQELEQKTKELENERSHLLNKIDLISTEKLQSSNRIDDLEKALHETLSATELLKTNVLELSGIRDGLELSNEKWKESYLQAENQLRRSKSGKANIDNYALSLEADVESLQSKCQHLQEESVSHLRSLNGLEEVLKGVQADKNQLTQELQSLVEEKEELEQINKKLKERETELEYNMENSKELIKILEADIQTLKQELEVAKSTTAELTLERDNMVLLRENANLQIQELQNLVQQIQEEKQLFSHEQQELETQLSYSNRQKDDFSRLLERCQVEKHEMATRLNSTQEEVALMRAGIEKLKVKIESDEKKKRQTIEKLKDSERKFDSLNDKIESLERELVMTEENLENAILQTESAQEEAECLKSQKEALEKELNMLRRKLVDVENDLQNSQAKVIELETTILTLTETLEKGEAEHSQFREGSEKELKMLQTQMNDMCEQKALTDQRCEAVLVECAEITARMEQERAQSESAIEEAKCLKLQKDNVEEELTMLRGKLVDVENDLQNSQAKVNELETTILTLTETLKKGEAEHSQFRESSGKELEVLQTQMNDMRDQKALTDQRYEAVIVECAEIAARMEQEKAQLESSKEEAKCLKSQKEAVEEELNMLRRKLVDVENGLQNSQARVIELETTIITLTETLEKGEAKHTQFRESSEKELELIQAQMNDMREQKALSDQTCEAVKVECAEITIKMEQEKAQLVQQLEEAQVASCDLKQSIDKLSLEVEECKLQLAEKTQHLMALETQRTDSEEWESKCSSECSQLKQVTENLISEKMNLLSRLEELENELQTMSAGNYSLQAIISDLQTSCNNLGTQLESANSEKRTLLEKVAELTENCFNLQSKLHDADLHIKTAEDQSCQDRKGLEDEMQRIKQLYEENSTPLHSTKSKITELKETITSLRNELKSQTMTQKNDIMEYERSPQAESLHKSLLDEAVKREDVSGYQKKLTSMDGLLAAQIQEIDGLKASSNVVVCKAQDQMAGLQAGIDLLTKESPAASEALNHWVNACKQLEQEKEELKKHIAQQEEELQTLRKNKHDEGMDTSTNDPFSEIEELKQCLEEKAQEADDSIEKYCNLMIKTHKLEEKNDMLRKQVDFLNSRLKGLQVKEERGCPPSVPDKPLPRGCPPSIHDKQLPQDCPPSVPDKPLPRGCPPSVSDKSIPEDCPPSVSDKPSPEAKRRTRKSRRSTQCPGKQTNKRQRDSDNTGSAPSTPQCVTKKVKRTSDTLAEQEEFELDGLPDIVREGFANIPSGKQSPFVLRRTTVPLRKSPRLASQKNSPSLFGAHFNNLENLSDLSSPTPGGSKSQETKTIEAIAMGNSRLMDGQSPLTAHNRTKRRLSEMGTPGKMDTATVYDDSEEEGTCHVQ
ncbi:PREDICTED: centromere protein F [Nanorana parkeri]|uniref:centromere protein F n=1 Tax=Nanorana parkeri TaxID=125878 RepID=UPI000854B8E9|nr:PREDICTED: centromere protein F [Nanorana parkeri]